MQTISRLLLQEGRVTTTYLFRENFNATYRIIIIHIIIIKLPQQMTLYSFCYVIVDKLIVILEGTVEHRLSGARATERGGGNWGILPWAPLCLWAPKDRYTLIE